MGKIFQLLMRLGVKQGAASVGKVGIDAGSKRLLQQIMSKDGAIQLSKALGFTAAEQMSSEVLEAYLYEIVEHLLLVDEAALADALMACITDAGDIAIERLLPSVEDVDKGEALAATLTVVLALFSMNKEQAEELKRSMASKGLSLDRVTLGGQTLLTVKSTGTGLTVYDAQGKNGVPRGMSANKRTALFFVLYTVISTSWSVYDHYGEVKAGLARGELPPSADRVELRAPGSSVSAIERETQRALQEEQPRALPSGSRTAERVAGPTQGDVPVLTPPPGRFTFTGEGDHRPDFAQLARQNDTDGVVRIIELDRIPDARKILVDGDHDYLLDAAQQRIAADIGVSPESVGRFAALVASIINAKEKRS